jgi:hypothetical protein
MLMVVRPEAGEDIRSSTELIRVLRLKHEPVLISELPGRRPDPPAIFRLSNRLVKPLEKTFS